MALLAACRTPREAAPAGGADEFTAVRTVAAGAVHVVVCLSQECPIANSYAPTLRQLSAGWAGRPVQVFLLHVDPDLTMTEARQHAADYQLPGRIVLDPKQLLTAELGFTRTPEVAVLTAAGMVYRGRIDDQWQALGSRSLEPSVHDLRDAVAAALAGTTSGLLLTTAVGCLLPEAAP